MLKPGLVASNGVREEPECSDVLTASSDLQELVMKEAFNSSIDYKGILSDTVSKFPGRDSSESQPQLVYSVRLCGMGEFLATVKVSEPISREFEGDVKTRKAEAENSAASAALRYFLSSTEFGAKEHHSESIEDLSAQPARYAKEHLSGSSEDLSVQRATGSDSDGDSVCSQHAESGKPSVTTRSDNDVDLGRSQTTEPSIPNAESPSPRSQPLPAATDHLSSLHPVPSSASPLPTSSPQSPVLSSTAPSLQQLPAPNLRSPAASSSQQLPPVPPFPSSQASVPSSSQLPVPQFQQHFKPSQRSWYSDALGKEVTAQAHAPGMAENMKKVSALSFPHQMNSFNSKEPRTANYKRALDELVMKVTGRGLRPEDVTYHVWEKSTDKYQAIARAPALDQTLEFEGLVHGKRKEAEQSAAQTALLSFSEKYLGAGSSVNVQLSSKPPETADQATSSSNDNLRKGNYKRALDVLVKKVKQASFLTPSDIVYTVLSDMPGDSRVAVKVGILEENLEFDSGPRLNRGLAEQAAARAALLHFASSGPAYSPSYATGAPSFQKSSGGYRHYYGRMGPRRGNMRPGKFRRDTNLRMQFPPQVESCDGTGDFKIALSELAQKISGKPIGQKDIQYRTKPTGRPGEFCVAVKVVPLNAGLEFDGEPHMRRKDAEQSAAKIALCHFRLMYGDQALGKRSMAPSDFTDDLPGVDSEGPSNCNNTFLNSQ